MENQTDSVVNDYGLFYFDRGDVRGPYQGFQFVTLGSAAEAKTFFGKKSKRKLHIRRSTWTPVS